MGAVRQPRRATVDILIELDGQASLLDFIGIKIELEDVLGGPLTLWNMLP